MTDRLYYSDAMLTSFEATVAASDVDGDRVGVVLDRTAFYPTSGGQPFDTGRLGTARVLDVQEREDGEIVHVLDAPLIVGAIVHGEVDWPRRFDHMQQHTGQHILSAAFDRVQNARTVSFHLGAETSTIDLARELTPAEIDAAEREANRIVWENRPVLVQFATDEEARALPLRKESHRTGRLRLVEVSDFDLSACGGTHVPHTGMIGIIAVSAAERFKGGSRVAFVAGARALHAFGQLRDVVGASTRLLSVASRELPATIERLQTDARQQSRTLRRLQESLAGHHAADLRAAAETIGGYRGVLRAEPGWDTAGLKTLAQAVVSEPGLVTILVGEGQPAPVVAARSADVAFDAVAWMQRAVAVLGGRGGGRPELAQGGLAADPARVLRFAKESLA